MVPGAAETGLCADREQEPRSLLVAFDMVRARDSSLVRYEGEHISGARSILTDGSRLYSSAIARFMALTMAETDALLFPHCSAQ